MKTKTQNQLQPLLFRNTRDSLAFPISVLFRNCIDLHEIPNEWKFAMVTPKFKSGSPSSPSNYRPIALTCTWCNNLESVISDQLITFLSNHSLITKAQHGFLKRHSTTANLIESLNSWTITLANHKSRKPSILFRTKSCSINSKHTEYKATFYYG